MAHQADQLLGPARARPSAGSGGRCPSRQRVPPALRRAREEAGPPLLLAADDAARHIGRRSVIVVGSGAVTARGRRRAAGGQVEATLAVSAAARALAGAAGGRSCPRDSRPAPLPAAARRQAAGRQILAASDAHDRAIDYHARQHPVGRRPRMPRSWPQLHAGLFDKAWDADSFRGLLSHPGSTAFLARRRHPAADRRASSSASSPPTKRKSSRSGVRKDSQRHGIGRRLVEASARAAKKAEARRLFLEVGPGNVAALGALQGARLPGGRAAQGLLSSTPAHAPRMR